MCLAQALLQHQLKDEQLRQRHATAELRRLQLSNPCLDAASISTIAGLDGQEQQQLQVRPAAAAATAAAAAEAGSSSSSAACYMHMLLGVASS
jgi:hypothetical protein